MAWFLTRRRFSHGVSRGVMPKAMAMQVAGCAVAHLEQLRIAVREAFGLLLFLRASLVPGKWHAKAAVATPHGVHIRFHPWHPYEL